MGNSRNIRVLSLCTGYGGLEIGLSRALDTTLDVVSVEIECYAQAVICKNAAKETQVVTKAVWNDLKTFPTERFRGCFDYILAGFPCQPFSVAGKRKGKGDSRWLWDDIERIIKTVRPVWCFFENVPGLLSLGFPSVYRSLRNLGYKVEAGLFTAAEVGATIQGQRLYILAQANSINRKILLRQRLSQCNLLENRRSRSCMGTAPLEWPPLVGDKIGWDKIIKEQPKSMLPGMAARITNKMDRLRLLGNGVVPQQAEKAFRYLMELFKDD